MQRNEEGIDKKTLRNNLRKKGRPLRQIHSVLLVGRNDEQMGPKLKQFQTAGRIKTGEPDCFELCQAHAVTLREGKSGHVPILGFQYLEQRVSDRAIARLNSR